MAFHYSTSVMLKATDIYQVMDVAKKTSKDNTTEPPNTVVVLTCPGIHAWGQELILKHLWELAEGEEIILQESSWTFLRGVPCLLVYKCPCGLTPCSQTGPLVLVDFENGATVHSDQLREGHVNLADLPAVFKMC